MEYIGILITGFIGIVSSVVTWILGRKKYNSEVDNNNIQNMKESLEFYKMISDDYKQRLATEIESHNNEVAEIKRESAAQMAELRRENAELKKELREQEKKFDAKFAAQQHEITMMKNQMLSVYSQVCLNFNCLERTQTKTIKTKISKAKKNETDIVKEVPEA